MPDLFEHARDVQPEEIDSLGHVNNLVYLRWMIDAALAHSAVQGWTNDRHHQLGSGWVVRAHQITYYRSAEPQDSIVIRTWIADWKRATSLRRYHILRAADRKLLAEASTQWAYINFETRLPTRIPPEVSESFRAIGDTPPPEVGRNNDA